LLRRLLPGGGGRRLRLRPGRRLVRGGVRGRVRAGAAVRGRAAAPLRRVLDPGLPQPAARLRAGTPGRGGRGAVDSPLLPAPAGGGTRGHRGAAGRPGARRAHPVRCGVLASTAAITGLVAFGGMRGTTWTQAVQFLLLLAALFWLAAAVLGSGFSYGEAVADLSAEPLVNPAFDGREWRLDIEPSRLDPDAAASFGEPGARYGRLGRFALIVTLVMGTAGLPHVMNRYFTSPTGTAARTTTVWVLGMAGLFYALAVMLGTAARALIPQAVPEHPWLQELTVDGVLRVPEHALPVLGRIYGGDAGLGVVAAGALVAVMSTIAGLLLAAAASWGHDVYERHINPRATQRQAVWAGRATVVVAGLAPASLALGRRPDCLISRPPSIVAAMVAWACALAGAALTPVFILAIWWRGTTAAGGIAGMVTGAVLPVSLFVVGLQL